MDHSPFLGKRGYPLFPIPPYLTALECGRTLCFIYNVCRPSRVVSCCGSALPRAKGQGASLRRGILQDDPQDFFFKNLRFIRVEIQALLWAKVTNDDVEPIRIVWGARCGSGFPPLRGGKGQQCVVCAVHERSYRWKFIDIPRCGHRPASSGLGKGQA